MGLGSLLTGALKFIPGIGQIVTAVEGVATIAGAVGGETGRKIQDGVAMITDGLKEADAQPLTGEQQLALKEAGLATTVKLRELDLEDVEGGRRLAKAEIASSDEYVRRTRPQLLRWYGKGTFLLIFSCVAVAFISAFFSSVDKDEAAFIIDVLKWALPTVSGTFLMMYRSYTGHRTREKLGEAGMQPETAMDKAIRLFRG
ncbi:hypothetical protein BerOc1_02971 [Pseudodesulfovibrio hydrargyri]|uniref:Holin of 3TMs, for gene-transfer release n=1 Tax=Pseudodesulfovibrio hydrargyri TaxID=2125990 RepID=A0A1J5MYE6_9BACT|nr:hypothetical protein [Pseudodesulfovibrio hydrargyri]OIQ51026.1 hypothetical protein BerOc1_02971 [Pseudodesulfovibrio hydrargyri]